MSENIEKLENIVENNENIESIDTPAPPSADVQIERLQQVLQELKTTNANLQEQLKQRQITNQKMLLMTDVNKSENLGNDFRFFSKYTNK